MDYVYTFNLSLTTNCYTGEDGDVFTPSHRNGANTWQVRKRWPKDCKSILGHEFVLSIGETDKEKAAAKLPLIAAEFRDKVKEARSRASAMPRGELAQTEAQGFAAGFFNSQFQAFTVKRRLEKINHMQLLRDDCGRLATVQEKLGRNDYGPVLAAGCTLMRQAGAVLDGEDQISHA